MTKNQPPLHNSKIAITLYLSQEAFSPLQFPWLLAPATCGSIRLCRLLVCTQAPPEQRKFLKRNQMSRTSSGSGTSSDLRAELRDLLPLCGPIALAAKRATGCMLFLPHLVNSLPGFFSLVVRCCWLLSPVQVLSVCQRATSRWGAP